MIHCSTGMLRLILVHIYLVKTSRPADHDRPTTSGCSEGRNVYLASSEDGASVM